MRRTGIAVIAFIACAAPAAANDLGEAMAKASAGQLAPLQMPDGTRRWQFVRQAIKGEHFEERLTSLIAQTLARAHWCSNGWEETTRNEAAGMLVVEGRCK